MSKEIARVVLEVEWDPETDNHPAQWLWRSMHRVAPSVTVLGYLDQPSPYTIDLANSCEGDFVVDVAGRGSVIIKAADDGISVDVYPLWVADGPVASCWADMGDLAAPEDEDEEESEEGVRCLQRLGAAAAEIIEDGIDAQPEDEDEDER